MIRGWAGRVDVDHLPLAVVEVKGKRHRRRLGGPSVVSDAVIVVRIIRAARKIDFFILLGTPSGNPIACRTRVTGELVPGNLQRIVTIDLARPAFLDRNVLRFVSGRVPGSAVHVNHGVADESSSVAEHGGSQDGSRL